MEDDSMRKLPVLSLLAGLVVMLAPPFVSADDKAEERLKALEQRVGKLESSIAQESGIGAFSFLYGAFCALWAQNTGRSAWLWFFLGLFFSVITVIFLLAKNSDDSKRLHHFGASGATAGSSSQ
jgi:hypothetical protein